MFLKYCDRLPALRARRMLEATQVAVYPWIKTEDARQLRREWQMQAVAGSERPSLGKGTLFTFNGKPMTINQLKGQLADVFGGRL